MQLLTDRKARVSALHDIIDIQNNNFWLLPVAICFESNLPIVVNLSDDDCWLNIKEAKSPTWPICPRCKWQWWCHHYLQFPWLVHYTFNRKQEGSGQKIKTTTAVTTNYYDIGITSFKECTSTLKLTPNTALTYCFNFFLTTLGAMMASKDRWSLDKISWHLPTPAASVINHKSQQKRCLTGASLYCQGRQYYWKLYTSIV